MNRVFWVSIPHILELHRRLQQAGPGQMVLSFIPALREGAAAHPCAKPLKEKLPAHR